MEALVQGKRRQLARLMVSEDCRQLLHCWQLTSFRELRVNCNPRSMTKETPFLSPVGGINLKSSYILRNETFVVNLIKMCPGVEKLHSDLSHLY